MSPPRTLVVYVDVDDTLIRSFGSKQIPIVGAVERVRALCAEPEVVAYCWSSGGADYARAVAQRLGMDGLFAGFLPKPNLLVDDQPLAAWRDLHQLHPNELQRVDADGVRATLGWPR